MFIKTWIFILLLSLEIMIIIISSLIYRLSYKYMLKLLQTLIKFSTSGHGISRYHYSILYQIPLSKLSNYYIISKKQVSSVWLFIKLVTNSTQTFVYTKNCFYFLYDLSNFSMVILFIYNSSACTTQPSLIAKKRQPPRTLIYIFFHSF